MATTASYYIASPRFSMFNNQWEGTNSNKKDYLSLISKRKMNISAASDQQSDVVVEEEGVKVEESKSQEDSNFTTTPLRPVEKQINVKSKNMGREYYSEWLSSATRHVRIYAAYVDPETSEFDQTQTDKLTLLLDPTDEFLWTDETTHKVYSYFQHLVDHYEGADLTEYTLRLIGSDIEHYIRKMLYAGEIQYNMNARVLNFSMGKPRIGFNYDGQISDNVVD